MVTDPGMLRAREMAMHLGGVPRMNTFSRFIWRCSASSPWEYVPTIPWGVLFLGGGSANFWDMSNW